MVHGRVADAVQCDGCLAWLAAPAAGYARSFARSFSLTQHHRPPNSVAILLAIISHRFIILQSDQPVQYDMVFFMEEHTCKDNTSYKTEMW